MSAPSKFRSRLILVALVAIFAAPPLGSWLLFRYTNVGRDATAHGTLIQPPRPLPDVVLVDAAGGSGRLHGRWTLLYLSSGDCAASCTEALYRMRQSRLATGTRAEHVQRVLVLATEPSGLARLAADWPGQWFVTDADFAGSGAFQFGPGDDPFAAGRLYLVDPRGYLMMSYAPGADPEGIITDLKRLLRYSGSSG